MHSAVSVTTPEMYGTYLPTASPYMNTTVTVPTYDSTSNPQGATGGSWRFDMPTSGNNKRIRTNTTTYGNQKVWDGQYGFGIWIKFNSFPTGTTTTLYPIFQTARTSSFPGAGLTISGSLYTGTGVAIRHTLFGANPVLIASPQLNTWYYIVIRKNRITNGATVWVNGVKVTTGTNTTFVEPVTSAETPYQIDFGNGGTGTSASAFSFNLCHAHLMDFDTFTDAVIADIYQAGITSRTVKYYDGSSWQTSSAQKVWNGTAWIDWNAKKYDGTSWVTI